MRYFILLLTLSFFSCTASKSTGNSTEAKVKKQLEKIIALVKKDDYIKLAPMIVYRGDDKVRKWKDVCKPLVAEELRYVERIGQQTKKYLGEDFKYNYKEYISETESEGTWHVLILKTTYKGEPKERAFAFLEIKGVFALGDID